MSAPDSVDLYKPPGNYTIVWQEKYSNNERNIFPELFGGFSISLHEDKKSFFEHFLETIKTNALDENIIYKAVDFLFKSIHERDNRSYYALACMYALGYVMTDDDKITGYVVYLLKEYREYHDISKLFSISYQRTKDLYKYTNFFLPKKEKKLLGFILQKEEVNKILSEDDFFEIKKFLYSYNICVSIYYNFRQHIPHKDEYSQFLKTKNDRDGNILELQKLFESKIQIKKEEKTDESNELSLVKNAEKKYAIDIPNQSPSLYEQPSTTGDHQFITQGVNDDLLPEPPASDLVIAQIQEKLAAVTEELSALKATNESLRQRAEQAEQTLSIEKERFKEREQFLLAQSETLQSQIRSLQSQIRSTPVVETALSLTLQTQSDVPAQASSLGSIAIPVSSEESSNSAVLSLAQTIAPSQNPSEPLPTPPESEAHPPDPPSRPSPKTQAPGAETKAVNTAEKPMPTELPPKSKVVLWKNVGENRGRGGKWLDGKPLTAMWYFDNYSIYKTEINGQKIEWTWREYENLGLLTPTWLKMFDSALFKKLELELKPDSSPSDFMPVYQNRKNKTVLIAYN